jgi:general L-amino acid transport system permease protein
MAPIPTNKGISRFFRTPGIPLLRDPKVRSIFFQSTAVLFLLWVIFTIANNTNKNLEERGIKTGFHFFDDIAPFAIPEKFFPFWSFELGESLYWEVLVIGIQNTVFISILGIISAAVLGFVVGVLRLSPNWLVSRFVGLYIEWFRNTPLLLQLLFWNFVVFLPLAPVVRNSWTWGEMFFLNKAGLYYPSPQFSIASAVLLIAALVSAIVAIVFMCRWAQRRKDTTGKMFPVFFVSLAIIAAFLSTGVFLAGEHLSFNYPQLKGLNYRGGGRVPLTAFVLWFGLTVYTAAFIAENVRGGILAVSHGQSEAASSLGLYRRITQQHAAGQSLHKFQNIECAQYHAWSNPKSTRCVTATL